MTPRIVAALPTHAGAGEHIDRLLAVCQQQSLNAPQTAYVLALAHHESRMGLWMLDRTSGWAYENLLPLGNTEPGDGPRFRGRGYVPLIGRISYARWGRYLELPLLEEPELAAVPDVAARILVMGLRYGRFTGHTLAEFVNESTVDYIGARRTVVNPTQAGVVAGYARRFAAALVDGAPRTQPQAQVTQIQRWLRAIGWPVMVDGMLGPMTSRCIEDFQFGYTLDRLDPGSGADSRTLLALEMCANNGGHASEHFRFAEFRTGGRQRLAIDNHGIRVDRRLVLALERYRSLVGGPVGIASGYRSPSYNTRFSGPVGCEHVSGLAVDLTRPTLTGLEAANVGLFASIGTRDGLAVHLAVSPDPARGPAGSGPGAQPSLFSLD